MSMRKRLTFITICSLAMAAAEFCLASVASAQPFIDPAPMTVQESDFSSATVVSQGSQTGGGVTGYDRMFANAKVGNESLAVVLSAVLVAPDLATAQQAFEPLATQAVASTGKQLARSASGRHGNVTVKLKFGAAQPLQAGDQAVLIPASVTATTRRLLKRRWVIKRTHFGLDFAFVRQDVAIEIIGGLGAAGGGLHGAMTALASDAATHMKTGLAPTGFVAPTITAGAPPAPGVVLSGVASPWTGSSTGESLTFVWERCDQSGLSCVAIPSTVGPAYALTPADVGSTIRLEVTYANADGSGAPSASLPTEVIGS
jgi:hypothetical protein